MLASVNNLLIPSLGLLTQFVLKLACRLLAFENLDDSKRIDIAVCSNSPKNLQFSHPLLLRK